MERKLASIQKVLEISPIKDADKIELAKVLGWQCVVKKSENFKVGELGIYFEIDSLLDESNPAYSHLMKDGRIKRLRTIQLKKQLSQGLLLPLSILNYYGLVSVSNDNYFFSITKEDGSVGEPIQLIEGLDVTEITKTKKYEPEIPAQLVGQIRGNFPIWLKKTDEQRLQSAPDVLKECVGLDMIGTMKIDGTSTTVYLRDEDFGVCSRNLDLKEADGNTYWKMVREHDIENKMKQYRDLGWGIKNFAIQFEIAGEGIQGNPLGLKGQQIFLFSFFDIDTGKYRTHETLRVFADKFGLQLAPIVHQMKFDETVTVKSLLELANNLNYPNGKPAEGIVWRPRDTEVHSDALNGRLSFKTISNKFLIDEKD
jgi:RNA ligase (TIGR02306 family)